MSAFQASYADLKIVKGRKVAQVILELPLEQADEALKILGGVPRPDQEVWVGVARLTKEAAQEPPQKERRRFDELPLPQQAALICKDERFQQWACGVPGEEPTVSFVRGYCGIKSRTELSDNPRAAGEFAKMLARYRQETGLEAARR